MIFMVMLPNIHLSRVISILVALYVAIPAAQADIYLSGDTEQEIHLSNIPPEGGYQVLIADSKADSITSSTPPSAAIVNMPFADAVWAAAQNAALDPSLLHAVIAAESGYNPKAVSPRGAQGLMQLMPATSRRFGLSDPYDPMQNVRAGASYLQELIQMFKGDLSLALAAYNAGPAAVMRFGSHIPPFKETRRYVPQVLKIYRELSHKP